VLLCGLPAGALLRDETQLVGPRVRHWSLDPAVQPVEAHHLQPDATCVALGLPQLEQDAALEDRTVCSQLCLLAHS
jgi:hypothetical protein